MGEDHVVVFDPVAIADVRRLLERRLGPLTRGEAVQFLQDLYDDGYVLATVSEV